MKKWPKAQGKRRNGKSAKRKGGQVRRFATGTANKKNGGQAGEAESGKKLTAQSCDGGHSSHFHINFKT